MRTSGTVNREFVVEVKADSTRLAEEMLKRGAAVRWLGKEGDVFMTVILPDGMKPRDVFVAARDRQVQVRGIQVARESMEQAFLRVINAGQPPGAQP